jgi:hypothetical protein
MSSDPLTAPAPPFFFDAAELRALGREHAVSYRQADPFPHVVIDDFLPAHVIEGVLAEFPSPENPDWYRFHTDRELKLALEDPEAMPPYARQVLSQFNSAAMVDFLEELTGIDGLIPDPHYYGGGLHQIEPGGHLDVHADFNWHKRLLLDRRLNLLLYLNKDWQPGWGGALELWNEDMTECRRRVQPIANRCVVFSTTDTSFHGHPEPLACPPGRTRRSLALYYYSNGRPAREVSQARTTDFKPRPGEQWRRGATNPGFLVRTLRAGKQRLTKGM